MKVAKLYMKDELLEDYLYTLELCKEILPSDTHINHYNRLDFLIEQIKHQLNL